MQIAMIARARIGPMASGASFVCAGRTWVGVHYGISGPAARFMTNHDNPQTIAQAIRSHFADRYEVCGIPVERSNSWFAPGVDSERGLNVRFQWIQRMSRSDKMRISYEASQLKKPSTAHLVETFDISVGSKDAVLVREDVVGEPLCDLLKHGRIETLGVLKVAMCIFGALDELHRLNLHHHNLNPANVIVRSDGSAQVVRQLLSIDVADHPPTERAHFFSPEQAGSIERDVAASSDLYAAGIVLFCMLTGRTPFQAKDMGSILLAHMTNPVPALADFDIDVPALNEVTQKLLRKDPSDRYQTAEAVQHDLQLIKESLERGVSDVQIVVGSSDSRTTLTEPAMVGRDGERSAIAKTLDLIDTQGNQLIYLEGDSGSGKTRLLDDVAGTAIDHGFTVFCGQCKDDVVPRPLGVFEGVMSVFLNQFDDATFAESFTRQFDGASTDLTNNFPKLESVFNASNPHQAPEELGERRSLRTMCSFINALGSADRPALIILDDFQWADELSQKLLVQWWREKKSRHNHVVVMVVFRSEEVSQSHSIRQSSASCHIRLSGLRDDDIRSLTESMAGQLPEETIQLVIKVAGGSPFMASAVLRGLVESGAIERGEDGWSINREKFDECRSSDDAAEFLIRRLELLGEDAIDLLSSGAILGKEFDLTVASYVTGTSPNEAIGHVADARKRNLIWLRDAGNRCVFSHDKIREALVSRISGANIRAMHAKAAEYLVSEPDSRPSDLAYHFHAAGYPQKALPYAIDAAEHAYRHHSLEAAKAQFLIAFESAPAQDNKLMYRIQKGLGDVLMLRGEYEAVEQYFKAAGQCAKGDDEQAQVLGSLADLRRRRGDVGGATAYYEQALRKLGHCTPKNHFLAILTLLREGVVQALHSLLPSCFVGRWKRPPTESERLALRLFGGLSHVLYHGSTPFMCFAVHLRGLNVAERYSPSAELAAIYSEHGVAISTIGLHRRAKQYAEKSLAMRRQEGDPWGEGQTLVYYSIALYASAAYEEAVARSREAIRLLERMGDYWGIHMARYQAAASLYHLGRFREAVQESRKNHASGIETGDFQASGIILDVWARANPGGVPEAILQKEMDRERNDPQGTCQVLIANAANLVGRGAYREAFESAEQSIKTAYRSGILNPYPVAAFVWATTSLRRTAESLDAYSKEERSRTLNKAARIARAGLLVQWMYGVDRPRLLRELALVRAMQNRPKRARTLLQKSMLVAEEQHADYDYAESLRCLADLGSRYGWPDFRAQYEEAEQLLSQLTIESGITDDSCEPRAIETNTSLSLADRFDTILDVGRRITAALTEKDVYKQTQLAAQRLLRCEGCAVIEVRGDEYQVAEGPEREFDRQAVQRATSLGRATSFNLISDINTADQRQVSVLCAPILVLGRVDAVLYATHMGVRDLFGPTEERLGDFVAAIAGASLENAHGYNRLQALNMTLEDRVAERTKAAEARAQELARSNAELERTANDLRSTEEQLREAIREATLANTAKSQFLATMSHEIRTPMNGILGMTDLLMRTPLTPQQESSLRVVRQSGETLLTLLNDILDLSKIEAGKMDLEHIQFDLRDVVENSARLLSSEAHQKQLEVICEFESIVPQQVTGDPNRLRQVLTNLVGNAIKFTNEGEIHIHVSTNESRIVFAVRDTGIGIPAEKHKSVFERFRQSDSSTTRQYGGTGLGLAISRTLVEMMGGTISLTSEPNLGSTFEFSIPFANPTLTQADRAHDPFRGLIAALVCEHRTASRSYRSALQCLGLNVMCFQSLSDVDEGDAVAFDLFVIDEPIIDAWQQQQWMTPPAIALTRPMQRTIEPIVQVNKPLLINELEQAIQLITQGGEATTPWPEATGGCSILLVDDSVVNQEVATGLLKLAGHAVVTANNGAEAVSRFKSQTFDLILMDLEMPEMDGLQATEEIRKLERGADVPIIAMSAHTELDREQQCYQAGVDAYVSKPFDPDQLLERIAELVQNNTAP